MPTQQTRTRGRPFLDFSPVFPSPHLLTVHMCQSWSKAALSEIPDLRCCLNPNCDPALPQNRISLELRTRLGSLEIWKASPCGWALAVQALEPGGASPWVLGSAPAARKPAWEGHCYPSVGVFHCGSCSGMLKIITLAWPEPRRRALSLPTDPDSTKYFYSPVTFGHWAQGMPNFAFLVRKASCFPSSSAWTFSYMCWKTQSPGNTTACSWGRPKDLVLLAFKLVT